MVRRLLTGFWILGSALLQVTEIKYEAIWSVVKNCHYGKVMCHDPSYFNSLALIHFVCVRVCVIACMRNSNQFNISIFSIPAYKD